MKLTFITVISLPSWRASGRTGSIDMVTWLFIQAASASKRATFTVQSFWANLKKKHNNIQVIFENTTDFNSIYALFSSIIINEGSVSLWIGYWVTICLSFYLPRTLVLCIHLHNQNNVQLASDKCCWYNDSDTLNILLRSDLYYNLLNIWMNHKKN